MIDDWQLRPAGAEDLAAVVEIFRAEDLRCRGRTEYDLTSAGERIAADAQFDVLRDQVVAEADGVLVGAGLLTRQGLNLAVHPDHDLGGLRRGLLLWAEHRQAELGRTPYAIGIPAANAATTGLLRDCGYEAMRFYAEMHRDFTGTGRPEPAIPPDGYRIRAIDPVADAAALHTLDDRAFRDRPDYVAEPADYYARRLLSENRRTSWSLLIEAPDGSLAASSIGEIRPDRADGYIAILACDPAHRRRGLARALLLESFARMYDAGHPGAELHVASDNPRALDLYTGVGMTEVPAGRIEHYERVP